MGPEATLSVAIAGLRCLRLGGFPVNISTTVYPRLL